MAVVEKLLMTTAWVMVALTARAATMMMMADND
jgi:hypothetical protein